MAVHDGSGSGQDDDYPDWMLTPKFAVVVAIFLLSTFIPIAVALVWLTSIFLGSDFFSAEENSNLDCYVRL